MNKLTLDDIKALEARHVVTTYKRQPVAFVRGSGSRLFDVDGREYLDFVSGIGVLCDVAGASYWPISLRATVLTRRHEGPGIACTAPSRPGTKASRRAANQLRTMIAPNAPTKPAAITSLT